MTNWHIAQLNVARLRESMDHPDIADFANRLDWFEKRTGPHFVLWWIPVGDVPTLEDADRRLRLLADKGPSAEAFTFMLTFAPPA